MRIVHLFVICALVFAAAYVYRIKMELTVRTERVMKLRADIRSERDAIARLHADWARLEIAGPPAGPGRAPHQAALHRRDAVRQPEEPARAAAELHQAERSRSDRHDDRGRRSRSHQFDHAAGGRAMSVETSDTQTGAPAEPWRRRLIRTLLYGKNVDRNVKARARVGFAIVAFVAIYGIIAGKLVLFGITAESNEASKRAAQDATATARPDILDRNGLILATDVKTSSLFGEPRRLVDRDEAVELLTGALPDLDTAEVRAAAAHAQGLRLAEARDHRRSRSGRSIGSAFRASASCARTSASIRPVRWSRT